MPTAASQRDGARAQGSNGDAAHAARPAGQASHGAGHELTVTVPLDRAVGMVTAPVAGVGRVLSAKGGLGVYVGLGVLAAADVIAWPVAATAGVGYAVLRRWGFRPPVIRPGGPGWPSPARPAGARPVSASRPAPAAARSASRNKQAPERAATSAGSKARGSRRAAAGAGKPAAGARPRKKA